MREQQRITFIRARNKNPASEALHFVRLDFLFQKANEFFCTPGKWASVRVSDDQLPGGI